MRNLTIFLLLVCSGPGVAWSQIRAFDNSKAILPWIYNPSVDFPQEFQVYLGYDGRGNNSFLPQSYVAGFRMPVLAGKGGKGSASVMGVQMLHTSQDRFRNAMIQTSFAHRISLSEKFKLAFALSAGVANMRYQYNDLVYFDQQDPLLDNGDNFFSMHLNAGISLVMDEIFFLNLAAPALIKDHRTNVREVIFRAGCIYPLNEDINIIPAANFDTFNSSLIFGGDVRIEWRKMISLLAGADRYKYHGGVLLNVTQFSFGYTYGQNFTEGFDYVPSHQISVFSNIPF